MGHEIRLPSEEVIEIILVTVAISKAFVVDLKLLPFAVGSRSVTAPERLGLYLLLDRGVLSPFGEIEWTLECDLDCVGIFT